MEPSYEELKRLFLEFIDNYGKEGLEEILSNLDNPQKLGYCKELVDNHIFSPVCRAPGFHNYMKKLSQRDILIFKICLWSKT